MKFVTVRELRSNLAAIRKALPEEGEVVVTANGKPFALLTAVDGDGLEEHLRIARQARALCALSRVQAAAKASGLDRMTMDEIDAEIAAARRERERGDG